MYSIEDISVIIPTYNRAEDLAVTLESSKKAMKNVKEIVIIDQSPDDKTKKALSGFKNKKLKYYQVYTDKRGIPIARNFGFEKAAKDSGIIVFLDDDVSLDERYFEKLLEVFNTHPEAKGVGGYYLPKGRKMSKLERRIRKFFLIEHLEKNNAQVLSAYGAVYPSELTKVINSQWIVGFNMAFKREVLEKMKFDEKLSKYALAEDFDFTYRVSKKFPKSLFITPYAKLIHRASTVERDPTEKAAYMNQVNHFYLNFKNFNGNVEEKLKFLWCVFGISFLRVFQFVKTRDKKDYLKLKYYFDSLFNSLRNLDKIKAGNLKDLYKA